VELHTLALALAILGGFRVAAIDMPGTGESSVALTGNAHLVYEGVISALRGPPETPTAVWGFSFGGHWAAKIACRGTANAAVDMGGPIEGKVVQLDDLPNGMPGIVANALGIQNPQRTAELVEQFSLSAQGLLKSPATTPLLAFNGAHDPYIPAADTLAFRAWPKSEVWLFRDGYHCAADFIRRIVPAAVAWLRIQLYGASMSERAAFRIAKAFLPARVYPAA
jgi:esterase FrsA